jgi:hypothetical protein
MIAIVSHDAGGAEILSSWLRRNRQPYCLVLGGPAIAIFQRKLGNCEIHPLTQAIELCDWVLCGTSWQSNLEKEAIGEAKIAGKKVVAFLDHWVEFEGRFQNQGVSVFPDEIWVGDVDAEIIAKKIFPEVAVVLKSNPYFDDLQIEFKATKESQRDSKKCSVLYVCEPMSEQALLQYGDERYFGYTEEDALQFFLKNIGALGCEISEIIIRPHPSESNNKYDWARLANSLVTETASTKTLIEQIVEADVVVGCESMAMVVALLAKKRVVSSISPGGNLCSLPQAEIEHLQVLVTKYQGTLDGG